MLASLLCNILFAAVINVAYTRFKADKDIMDALVHLRKKTGAGGPGEATAGDPVPATLLWGMLYADDVGVVSQSPGQLRKMMGVIMVVRAAFGLTVSEAKTEIMCLRTKGMPESTVTISVEAARQVYNQTNEFVYLGGNVNHNSDLSIKVNRRIRNTWCGFWKYTPELYDRPSAPPKLKIRMLRAEVLETMLYGCVTSSPRACHNDTLRRAPPGYWLAASVGENTIAPTTRFPIWTRLSRREVRASRRLYAGGGSCLRGLWRAWRIRDCRSA